MTEFTGDVGGAGDRALTSEQVIADDADLRAGIGALAGQVAGSLGLSELLAEVAAFAVRAIPGADGAGVTLLRVDRVDNMVEALAASAAFVAEIDEIQYVTLKEGPCITAALEGRTVRSDQVIGAINVYARDKDVFDEHAAELGELFAKPAAVAVHNARILAHAMALTAELQKALSTRPVIDQAIGLIRGRTGLSAEDAFTQLRAISQSEHRKLADVAQHLVDEAVSRARARYNPT
jgi:hypothetical protein